MEKEKILETCVFAAKDSGRLLLDFFGKRSGMNITMKGPRDPVTVADLASQETIIERIRKRHPGHKIMAEEKNHDGTTRLESDEWTWIVDPLDGTVNFLHGIPLFAVSIAAAYNGKVRVGVVFIPTLGELFTAVEGKGAFLNGKRINVSGHSSLSESVLATGFPYNRNENPNNNLDHFNDFFLKVRGLRRMGVASVDLAWVAAGRIDGFWELHLKPWDVAAGSLLVTEAGGAVTDFHRGGDYLFSGEIVASNLLIHDNILSVLYGK